MTRVLVATMAIAVLSTAANASVPAPFLARYDVRVSGLGGELTSRLVETPDGGLVFENSTRAHGIARLARPENAVDRSEFRHRVRDGSVALLPLRFESTDGTRRNKRGSDIVFDWDTGIAQSSYKSENRDIPLDAGLMDRQLMQIAMMRDLADGLTEASYVVIDRNVVKRYQVRVLGTETVEVPAGSFEAVKVRRNRPGSSRSTLMWCAPELQYLPVRIEQLKGDKTIGTLSLTALAD